MKVKRIEVLPHARSPIGDYAVIKLHGIDGIDGAATFQLESDSSASGMPPLGDLKPLGIRTGKDSVELLIGPEIVRSKALAPGDKIRFILRSAEVDALILWPDLSGPGATPDNAGSQKVQRRNSETDGDGTAGLARLQMKTANALKPAPVVRSEHSSVAATPQPRAYAGYRQRVATEKRMQAQSRSRRPAAILVPAVLGLVIVGAMLVSLMRSEIVEGSGVTLFSVLRGAADEKQNTGDGSGQLLSSILRVGTTSPSGADASQMPRRVALERANELLDKAKSPKDRAEAEFYLRKALADSLSDRRLVWAVTQLGAAYATGGKEAKPNYYAARVLWTWAGDAGDAQAVCFLGQLHERGLGVRTDTAAAREAYNRARQMGGCPGLEQAMLRVGK